MGSKYDGVLSKIALMEPFNAGNFYSVQGIDGLYVVYSYGHHYPLAIGHPSTGKWAVCVEPSSRTTGKHRGYILRGIYPTVPVEIPTCSGMNAIIRGESRILEIKECIITS